MYGHGIGGPQGFAHGLLVNAPKKPTAAERARARLSDRERDVLTRMGRGETLQGIADALGISPSSVGTYRRRVMVKIGVDTNAGLVLFAAEAGLVRAS